MITSKDILLNIITNNGRCYKVPCDTCLLKKECERFVRMYLVEQSLSYNEYTLGFKKIAINKFLETYPEESLFEVLL